MDKFTALKVVAFINHALAKADPEAAHALIKARALVEERLLELGWRNDPVDVPEMNAAQEEALAEMRI